MSKRYTKSESRGAMVLFPVSRKKKSSGSRSRLKPLLFTSLIQKVAAISIASVDLEGNRMDCLLSVIWSEMVEVNLNG